MAQADGSIRIEVVVDADGAVKEINSLSDGLEESVTGAAKLADKLKVGLAEAAKVGVAAIGAATAGVAALTKAALDSYAEYEQLTGGVETLFKDSSGTVMEYAANAYKTAGLSANEYMETVTSFSASLLQSLDGDTAKAAQVADRAITDMSDNANKMGTSMESIQNAYQGFAKQNYTMLDNLKLGYGGTKEEMERLLADAQAISGIEYDISSYADIVEAIHVIQTEMGITGTTAKEASTTIQGSIASMGSAWNNLVTGIADENADLDLLIGNFVDSVATAGENVLPRVEQILSGIGELITKLAPTIGAEVPKLIAQVLPSLVDAGMQLIDGIVQGVGDALPQLADAAMDIIITLGEGITEYIPKLIAALPGVISAIVDFIAENLPGLLNMGLDMLRAVADGILQAIPELLAALPEIIDTIVTFVADNLPAILDAGIDILLNLATGIIDAIPKLVAQLPKIIQNITSTISKNLPKIIQSGFELLLKLWDGIYSAIPKLAANLPQVVTVLLKGLGEAAKGVVEVGKNIVTGLWNGISSMISWVKDKISGFVGGIIDGAKNLLGIHSPSKVFAEMGKYLGEGFANGIDASASVAVHAAKDMANAVSAAAIPNVTMPNLGESLRLASIPSISNFSIPAIVAGTALPPNPEFTATMRGGSTEYQGKAIRGESGGDNGEVLAALQTIANLLRNGQTIKVDGTTFGRTAIRTINDANTAAGKQLLKL